MSNEIEVGEYVRTRAGHIYKITNIDENGLIYWNKIQCGWSEQQLEDIIVKHSKQLIDLIENKDVLKVRIDKTIMLFGIDEDTSDIKYKELIENIENGEYELLEILTHEQFEANCYKVGGEDE